MTLLSLPDLFRRCRQKETGHWWVVKDHKRTLYLDSGDIVYASSTFQEDKLTSVMVECGKLTRDQMGRAMANLKPGISIGKNLIEMGLITQSDLLEAARLQVARIVRCALAEPAAPGFEAMDELERNIVRLPLDTPFMLFVGAMGLSDKEAALELLGPLNQVVLLQSKRVYDLGVPDALAGLLDAAALMDGTRTILEMCGQTGLDAATLGSFALFLREMGWAKLFELPPIDRKGLDEALTVPDPTKPPTSIPPPSPSPRDILFQDIKDAGKQTTSLEHLAKAIDDLPSGAPPPTAPEKPNAETTGPIAMPPTPPWPPETSLEHTGDPEDYAVGTAVAVGTMGTMGPLEDLPEQVGRVIIAPDPGAEDGPRGRSIVIGSEPGEPDGAAGDITKPAKPIKIAKPPKEPKAPKPAKTPKTLKVRRRSGGKAAVLVLAAILATSALLAAWWAVRAFGGRRQPPFTFTLDDHPHEGAAPAKPGTQAAPKPQTQAQAQAQATAPQTKTQNAPDAPKAQDAPKTQDAPRTQAQDAPKAQAQVQVQVPPKAQPDEPQRPAPDISAAARFAAISQGNASTAVEQGKAYRDRLPKSAWTIRLVVAEQRDTLKNCARALEGGDRDVFVMPLKMRNGRTCYQLFLGNFPTRLSAEAELKRLPELLQRQSPKLMQVTEIVAEQQ